MKLLAIETSCDETAAAVIGYDTATIRVLGESVSSQITLHAPFGGVVPNLAAREHVRNIKTIVETSMRHAGVRAEDLDGLAVTCGPGLIPALLVGVSAAKTLALTWNKPLLGINHLEGHIYANLLAPNAELRFPLLALIVSGGHTQLLLMRGHFSYELLGETEDDAAGEAFDKVAKMLGLPYPGGPEVAKRADAHRAAHAAPATLFPRPMITSHDYTFSFSGLKTAVLYYLRDHADQKTDAAFIASIAHEFQEAVIDVLVNKTERALREHAPRTLVIAGGVSANTRLRERIEAMVQTYPDCQFLMPPFRYSLDNAAMIGAAGILRLAALSENERKRQHRTGLALEPSAKLPLAH
jgi:N6-L-threonylcarbamoyladenine synthase